jgi:hypothetical protein
MTGRRERLPSEEREMGYVEFSFKHLIDRKMFHKESGCYVYLVRGLAKAPAKGACLLQDYWHTAGQHYKEDLYEQPEVLAETT